MQIEGKGTAGMWSNGPTRTVEESKQAKRGTFELLLECYPIPPEGH